MVHSHSRSIGAAFTGSHGSLEEAGEDVGGAINPIPAIVLGALALGAVGLLLWKARKMGAARTGSLRDAGTSMGLTWVGDADAAIHLSPFPFFKETVPRGLTNVLKGSREGRDILVADYAFSHSLRDNDIWRQTCLLYTSPSPRD